MFIGKEVVFFWGGGGDYVCKGCLICCLIFVHLLSKSLIKQSQSWYYIMNTGKKEDI